MLSKWRKDNLYASISEINWSQFPRKIFLGQFSCFHGSSVLMSILFFSDGSILNWAVFPTFRRLLLSRFRVRLVGCPGFLTKHTLHIWWKSVP
jgi:hypothetical protein